MSRTHARSKTRPAARRPQGSVASTPMIDERPVVSTEPPTPIGVLLWFGWALGLLAVTGLLLPRIIGFIDFSEKAPFSLLGIFMMAELAIVIFGITVALQRKRIAHRFALGIALLPAPVLAGLPPTLLGMPSDAALGWAILFIPIGIVLSIVLVALLLRPTARAYFSEP
ncbi:MAG: hypothetical protein ABI534_04460 [Chloroflexota bacterium]